MVDGLRVRCRSMRLRIVHHIPHDRLRVRTVCPPDKGRSNPQIPLQTRSIKFELLHNFKSENQKITPPQFAEVSVSPGINKSPWMGVNKTIWLTGLHAEISLWNFTRKMPENHLRLAQEFGHLYCRTTPEQRAGQPEHPPEFNGIRNYNFQ